MLVRKGEMWKYLLLYLRSHQQKVIDHIKYNYLVLKKYNYLLNAAKIDSVNGSTCATIKITHQNSSIYLDAQDLSRLSQGWEKDSIECCLNDKVCTSYIVGKFVGNGVTLK